MEQSIFNQPTPFAWITIPNKNYQIAKYPLTNAQFAKFIEAGGYSQRQWWTEAGWEAKEQGLALDYMSGKGLPTNIAWAAPRHWDDSQWNGADYPVVGVTWYEALAYCRWLSKVTGENITLPTEEQWQYAAQGDDGRTYPWGSEWDCTRCNNSVKPCASESTTPVQAYEGKGDSPFGVVDMSGNVWEWCLSTYADHSSDPEGDSPRIIKGGGWLFFTAGDCRATFRYYDSPSGCYNFRGFRIIRLPASS